MSISRSSLLPFLRSLLRSPRSIGAIAPSSRGLARAMVDAAGIDQARTIVEFGPGLGVVTDEIIRRMSADARLLVFEIEPRFVAALRSRIHDSRVTILDRSAAEIQAALAEHGLERADAIISSLPFTSLPRPLTLTILQATVANLRPGGAFVLFQYTPMIRRLLETFFPAVLTQRVVLRNLPPAIVYLCRTLP